MDVSRRLRHRHDLGHLADSGSIDMQASTAVWRCKGKSAIKSRFDRALLAGFISGSLHTQQRMSRAGLAADPSPRCVYCNGPDEETQEHILLHCPCWAKLRAPLLKLTSAAERAVWPPATRHCAIILQENALTDAKVIDASASEPPLYPALIADLDSTVETTEIDDHGISWLIGATDGACSDQAHELLARAGYGVYFGEGHSQNFDARLYGPCQNAQRAETTALLHLMKIAWVPTVVLIDNKYVVDTFQGLLDGTAVSTTAHSDLWRVITSALDAKGRDFFRVKHVRSHLGAAGVASGLISVDEERLNSGADTLATRGAASHAVCPVLRSSALHRHKIGTCLQRLAILCARARLSTAPASTRQAGFAESVLSALTPAEAHFGLHDDTIDHPSIDDLENGRSGDEAEDPFEDPFGHGFELA
jgi:ribonuclease HI